MDVELTVNVEASDDLDEAYSWYESRSVGACIESICRTPTRHTLIRGNYRRAFVRQFPYVVYYEFENDCVTIYGVLHSKRNPDVWKLRLQK